MVNILDRSRTTGGRIRQVSGQLMPAIPPYIYTTSYKSMVYIIYDLKHIHMLWPLALINWLNKIYHNKNSLPPELRIFERKKN